METVLTNIFYNKMKINNNIYKHNQITEYWVTVPNLFNNNQINKIVELCEQSEQEPASIINGKDFDIRKSNVSYHNLNEQNSWIFDNINYAIEELNNHFYNFEIYGYDAFQYTKYLSSENGKYNYHTDTVFGKNKPITMTNTRKLSAVVLLSEPEEDFTGGEFEIFLHGKVPMQKGQLILFPSFMVHKVNEVTSGERKSLVVWVEGPKFK